MNLCPCHGLEKALNGQCRIKKRETQRRYEKTDRGKATLARYQRTAKGWARSRRDKNRRRFAEVLVELDRLQAEKEGLSDA